MKGLQPHSYALLDEIVLVPLQLGLQPVRLGLHLLRRLLDPAFIQHGIWFVRGHVSECLDGVLVAGDISAALGLVDGGLEGVDGEIGRGAADEE